MMDEVTMPGRLTAYSPRERYEWVDAPEDSNFAGFAVDVRVNLTNAELRDYQTTLTALSFDRQQAGEVAREQLKALRAEFEGVESPTPEHTQERRDRAKAIDHELKERIEALDRAKWALAAPYIRAWNVYRPGKNGTPEPAPPPCDTGAEAFEDLTPAMAQWVLTTVETAYASGKGLARPSAPPGNSPELTPTVSEGPQMVADS